VISGESVSLHTNDKSTSSHIPVVLVVIEGGLDTIKKGFFLSYSIM